LQCFVLADNKQPIRTLERQLPSFVKKYYFSDQASALSLPHLRFQPLKEIHLDKRFDTFKNDGLSAKELWSLGLIGLFLLLVACINFINLATAQSVTRAKEIGVRKVLGSDNSQIRKQFLYETGFITLLAVIVGCLLALLALPWLGQLMQKDLSLHLVHIPSVLLFIVLLSTAVTLLAGFYPAIVLSGFNPVMIFKNKMNVKIAGGLSLRKALVVFQFIIAQLLIIGTIVVVKQMQYFRSRSLGFEKDGIAMINLPSDSSLRVKYPLLKNSLLQIRGVRSASICMEAPSNFWEYNTPFYFNNNARKEDFNIALQVADTGYYETFGIKLVAGRFPFHSDTLHEIVVNETAARKLGFSSPEEIIGKTITTSGVTRHPIVGVIHDYNNRSLHLAISPLAIGSDNFAYEWIAVRVDKNNMKTTLDQVQKVFTEIYPTYIYDRVFLDERIEHFYKSEAITAQLFKVFAFLVIFISCLGLYGLVSFMAVQKTKEVGIRKVLGASVQNIVYLFSKEFTVLIGAAFLIAAPVSYYFMKEWLSGFYYHTSIGWGVFVLAIVASVMVAWVTVGYKAIKAALVNPVKSLKTE
jgi:ABC-type lipoprotein release transport system permease subunit